MHGIVGARRVVPEPGDGTVGLLLLRLRRPPVHPPPPWRWQPPRTAACLPAGRPLRPVLPVLWRRRHAWRHGRRRGRRRAAHALPSGSSGGGWGIVTLGPIRVAVPPAPFPPAPMTRHRSRACPPFCSPLPAQFGGSGGMGGMQFGGMGGGFPGVDGAQLVGLGGVGAGCCRHCWVARIWTPHPSCGMHCRRHGRHGRRWRWRRPWRWQGGWGWVHAPPPHEHGGRGLL